jgi:AcrR family transcriptional regulator
VLPACVKICDLVEEGARRYRGVAAADRRAQRRARLVAAVLDILGAGGIDAVTVRGVCDRAGLTRRYFYESFTDLDALLVAVFDEINAEIAVAILGALARSPAEPVARARVALAAGLEVVTGHPGKGRLVVASTTSSGALARRRAEVVDGFAAIVAAQVRELAGHPIPDRLIEMAAVLLVGGVTELVGRWLAGGIVASRAELVEDCATLLVAAGEAVARGPLQ